MWNFSVSGTLGILLKTWPFVLLRIVVYSAITIFFMVARGRLRPRPYLQR